MDLSHMRKGFMKVVKVPSFGSRSPKSPSTPLDSRSSSGQYNTAAVDYFVKQDMAPQVKKVTFVVPISADEGRYYDTVNHDSYYGAIADEYVNMNASNYILSVKERFRLERLNSERRVSQEVTS